jgi:hypothetical protein
LPRRRVVLREFVRIAAATTIAEAQIQEAVADRDRAAVVIDGGLLDFEEDRLRRRIGEIRGCRVGRVKRASG